MRNILAILMMVSFAASAAQESNTEKLNKALATGEKTGKNVLIVVNEFVKESSNKEKDREQMKLEMRKLFAEIRTNKDAASKIKKLRDDFNSKYRYDSAFLNEPSFKEYASKNLVVLTINVGDVKDLPNKLKNEFKVRNIPSVILVKKDKVVHRMRNVAGRGGRELPPAWHFIQVYSREQKKEKPPKAKLKPRSSRKPTLILDIYNTWIPLTGGPPLCGIVGYAKPPVSGGTNRISFLVDAAGYRVDADGRRLRK